jgi:hypothetical protein
MTITEQYIDAAGKIRMVVLLSSGESIMLKFSEQPTTTVLEAIETNYIAEMTIQRLSVVQYEMLKFKDLFKVVVDAIKANPAMTLTQYTNHLATKQWFEQGIINTFMYVIAVNLAERGGIVLANQTQSTIWTQVRNWIVATPGRNIARILFNE